MLGKTVADPTGIEGPAGTDEGLGLLDVETVMTPRKEVRPVRATHRTSGLPLEGYEIHIGRTEGPDTARPFADLADHTDGATNADGRIAGTYLHGMFASDMFRANWLGQFGVRQSFAYEQTVETVLDRLASHLERNCDVDAILSAAAEPKDGSLPP